MRFSGERGAVAVSAPLMLGGLAAAAVAEDWPMRLGGAAMVVGASAALALVNERGRRVAWSVAAVGLVAVLVSCL